VSNASLLPVPPDT